MLSEDEAADAGWRETGPGMKRGSVEFEEDRKKKEEKKVVVLL